MRRADDETNVGEDSFLDTTANLVGILIILVVVIGSKTKLEAEEYGRQMAAAEASPQLAESARTARALADSMREQAIRQKEYELESAYRRAERDSLLVNVQIVREKVAESLLDLDAEKRASLEHARAVQKLHDNLSDVQDELGAQDELARPKIVLEHLPTPMAQTVFNREMHLQLKAGAVTVIPWDRLVDTLKEQVPLAARRQASKAVLEEIIGPLGGFIMRYRMTRIPGGYELERFELETSADAVSERLLDALAPAGRLRLELASRNPAETVITVWVYPDSFGEFAKLKTLLFQEGFLCAARPLPEGVRIGASPRGSRSSAQ